MRISIIQHDIRWEDIRYNLDKLETLVTPLSGKSDLIILPEMFTTGFSMNGKLLAEKSPSVTAAWMKRMSSLTGATFCASYIALEDGRYFNRLLFVTPSGEEKKYDKRHLFSIGGENQNYTPGTSRLVFNYLEFRISTIICYDLRFPVWIRNRNDYDLLICVANWPGSRREVWKTLLKARALENQCYVAAVNRIGDDPEGNSYAGDSVVLDPRAAVIAEIPEYSEGVVTCEVSITQLEQFRKKFPVWKDADDFTINI